MKIQEILEAKMVDMDDEADEPQADADQDKVPNILMQLRKAIDVDGNYPITFADGSKHKLTIAEISYFIKKYMTSKPNEKEELQNIAIKSYEDFKDALVKKFDRPEIPKIKGDRYMSHFDLRDEPGTPEV